MKGTVLKPLDPKEVREFCVAVNQQIPAEIFKHPELVRKYIRNKRLLRKVFQETLLKSVEGLDLDHNLELWQRVYWEICGLEPSLRDIRVPDDPGGFGWPVVPTPEIPLNKFWHELKKKFPCWCHGGNDLESLLDWNKQERSYRDGAYAIRVRDRIEADEELKNLPANDIVKKGIATVTLDERVRLEGFYWIISSGKHLDIKNVTLCAGSRYSGGGVPHVDWCRYRYGLHVCWFSPAGADGVLRSRQAVC